MKRAKQIKGSDGEWAVEVCSTHVAVTCPIVKSPYCNVMAFAIQVSLYALSDGPYAFQAGP